MVAGQSQSRWHRLAERARASSQHCRFIAEVVMTAFDEDGWREKCNRADAEQTARKRKSDGKKSQRATRPL
jgi:hypothetical protein